MLPSRRKHRSKRPSLFWLVALLFLWQQVTLAASLCPTPPSQIVVVAATPASHSDCMQSMRGGHDQVQKAMCAEHCLQGSLVQSDARLPNLPGSVVPPLAPAMPIIASLPHAAVSFASAFQLQADHPPLRLLFCSLLI